MRLVILAAFLFAAATSARAQSCVSQAQALSILIDGGYSEKMAGSVNGSDLQIWANENGDFVVFLLTNGAACILTTGSGFSDSPDM